MGSDFIEKATPSFKKSWDRHRVELETSDLFTQEPTCTMRTATAESIGEVQLKVGDNLIVEIRDGSLIAMQGNSPVAQFDAPPQEIVEAVENSCGIAKGRVDQVNNLSGVMEISLC